MLRFTTSVPCRLVDDRGSQPDMCRMSHFYVAYVEVKMKSHMGLTSVYVKEISESRVWVRFEAPFSKVIF